MWSQSRKDLSNRKGDHHLSFLASNSNNELEGFYIFGGQDSKNKTLNELWVATPDYEKNKQSFDSNFEYKKHKLHLKVQKVTKFEGQPPCPRIQTSSCVIKTPQDESLFVIYGGRND